MSYIEDLQAKVRVRGAKAVAKKANLRRAVVQRFLEDWGRVPIGTMSRIARAADMPHGEFHLVDQQTGACHTCGPDQECTADTKFLPGDTCTCESRCGGDCAGDDGSFDHCSGCAHRRRPEPGVEANE